jgi:hypothetical protein
MSCGNQSSSGRDDSLDVKNGSFSFEQSGRTAWVLAEAVRQLNRADKGAEAAYVRAVEVLREFGPDLLETVIGLFRHVESGDAALRWNALHVLGDAGGEGAAAFLVRTALARLPDTESDRGCESGRDMEVLVCTMAVHALRRLAVRHPAEASEAILRIVSQRPAQPILIEAVKAAVELRLDEKVRGILAQDDHWILDIRRSRAQEVFADPEREDGKERGFTPPKSGALYTAPSAGCCKGKES